MIACTASFSHSALSIVSEWDFLLFKLMCVKSKVKTVTGFNHFMRSKDSLVALHLSESAVYNLGHMFPNSSDAEYFLSFYGD